MILKYLISYQPNQETNWYGGGGGGRMKVMNDNKLFQNEHELKPGQTSTSVMAYTEFITSFFFMQSH